MDAGDEDVNEPMSPAQRIRQDRERREEVHAPIEADEDWICPITQDVMYYPARLPSGRLYEFDAILRWLGEYGTDPLTRQQVSLPGPPPIENETRAKIEAWRQDVVSHHVQAAEELRQELGSDSPGGNNSQLRSRTSNPKPNPKPNTSPSRSRKSLELSSDDNKP